MCDCELFAEQRKTTKMQKEKQELIPRLNIGPLGI